MNFKNVIYDPSLNVRFHIDHDTETLYLGLGIWDRLPIWERKFYLIYRDGYVHVIPKERFRIREHTFANLVPVLTIKNDEKDFFIVVMMPAG